MQNVRMIDHRLATLRTFASCGTVTATAELTGLSPSAVSAQLRELQRSLGITLFERSGRGLKLTSAGRYLVRRSDVLVEEWERMRAGALHAGEEAPLTFAIGGFSTAASNLLAPLGAHLRATRPGLQVRVTEADPARCLDLLTAGRLDLAVIVATQAGADAVGDARFEQVDLLDDPLDVMVPAGHRVARRDSVSLQELAEEDWISEAPGGPYRALFTAAFVAAGLTPRVSHEVVEWETAMALVGAGLGLGLLPRLVSLAGVENVVRVRLGGPTRPVRKIVAVTRPGGRASVLIRDSLATLQALAKETLQTRIAEEF
jgi:DNA-binding transcriptional LysR family regulator